MDGSVPKTVVVSAVNIRKGGTLTILRDCLEYLSGLAEAGEWKVVALVHDRSLCEYPSIEYIEIPWTIKSWVRRLWCEYVTMHRISKDLARREGRPVYMWLSLHDTTPRVVAEHQEVYCHTSFPFLKVIPRDWKMDPKVPLFAHFTRWAYRINVKRNDCLIVQQEWFRDAMAKMLHLPLSKFRVIPPKMPDMSSVKPSEIRYPVPMFFYASSPDCHKNFETLCEAARMLEKDLGKGQFKVVLSISGKENKYARWIYENWGSVNSIEFAGYMSREDLFGLYKAADAFVFPSRVETWGLPISEFLATTGGRGRLLLADLPYAHGVASDAPRARYFPVMDAKALKQLMYESIAVR
ncbi:MAG: glycosyltransferase family 4 protein [Bacteroidales bacterium]|nr:glycosyltransferase family 4 protein [Bacteroidales bacterium]